MLALYAAGLLLPLAITVQRAVELGAAGWGELLRNSLFTGAAWNTAIDSAQITVVAVLIAYTIAAAIWQSAPVMRALLTTFVNRPVLTIGHGEDFCSFGGMFCLQSTEAGERIQANLDSISRSGLRINPQLLRLTQRDRSVR